MSGSGQQAADQGDMDGHVVSTIPTTVDIPLTVRWRKGIGLGLGIDHDAGVDRLPKVICDLLRSEENEEFKDVEIGKDEALARMLLVGNHIVTMCGSAVSVEDGQDTISGIRDALSSQSFDGDSKAINLTLRIPCTLKKSKLIPREEIAPDAKLSVEDIGTMLEKARSLLTEVYRSQIEKLHQLVENNQVANASKPGETHVAPSSTVNGLAHASNGQNSALITTSVSTTRPLAARHSESLHRQSIFESYKPTRLEKKFVECINLEQGTLRRRFAAKYVDLMKEARTTDERCMLLMPILHINRRPKLQSKLIGTQFYSQLNDWGSDAINNSTPWVDTDQAISSKVAKANDLCICILEILKRVAYLEELALQVREFLKRCKASKISNAAKEAFEQMVEIWKTQRKAHKEAKAQAKKEETMRQAELAKKAAEEARAAEERAAKEARAAEERAAKEAKAAAAAAEKAALESKKRKFDSLGSALFESSKRHKIDNHQAAENLGKPSSPGSSVIDLPPITSFESARKSVRDGLTVRFLEVSPEKQIYSDGSAAENPAFKIRKPHVLIACTAYHAYDVPLKRNTSQQNQSERKHQMVAEGLAGMLRNIPWHTPRLVQTSKRSSFKKAPHKSSFAAKCLEAMKKQAPVRIYRKRIAAEAPLVRILKGLSQPNAGTNPCKIFFGSDHLSNQEATMKPSNGGANTTAEALETKSNGDKGISSGVAAVKDATLPAKLPYFFNTLRKDINLLQELSARVSDPDGTPLKTNEDLELRLRLLQTIPEISQLLQESMGENDLRLQFRSWLVREGGSVFSRVPPKFFSYLSPAWQQQLQAKMRHHQNLKHAPSASQQYYQQHQYGQPFQQQQQYQQYQQQQEPQQYQQRQNNEYNQQNSSHQHSYYPQNQQSQQQRTPQQWVAGQQYSSSSQTGYRNQGAW